LTARRTQHLDYQTGVGIFDFLTVWYSHLWSKDNTLVSLLQIFRVRITHSVLVIYLTSCR